MNVRVRSQSPEATEAFAERMGRALVGGEIVLLVGALGAGKTCFVRGLARGLDLAGRGVKSPTYAVMHCYGGGRLALDHFDAYFVREVDEFARTGMFEFLDRGHVAVVEWADRFPGAFGADVIEIQFAIAGESERALDVRATGPRSRRALSGAGWSATEVGS